MTVWRVGNVSISAIFEVDCGRVIDEILPDAAAGARRSVQWLRPRFVDAEGGSKAHVQAFAIKSGDTRILVDPGVGNGKTRPEIPAWSGLRSNFVNRLAAVGFAPPAVQVVVVRTCTSTTSGG